MISRRVYILSLLIALGLGALVGVLGYIYFVGGSGDPSRDVQAATLSPSGNDDNSSGTQTFTIVPQESQVSFTLQEDLRGVRQDVVGVTNQIAGNIIVNRDSPSATQIGPIEINLRTLQTPDEFRNRAIRSEILESARDEFEFTTFTPTAISGLPESVSVGDTFSFTLTGDLPLRQITRSVEWDVTVTIVSDDRIEGNATTMVRRSDYDLQIPVVPGVANVTDEVALAIDFVAVAQ